MVVTRKEIPLYPKPFREANVLNNLCYEDHPSRGYGKRRLARHSAPIRINLS
jgi:hypothetical protein